MGRDERAGNFFTQLLSLAGGSGIGTVIVDGDGLFHLAGTDPGQIPSFPSGMIITPHFGEASRLLGDGVDEIKKNRPESAMSLAKKYSSVALLKGPATIITDGDYTYINTSGNRSMATAGSGDVLCGIIGALALRGYRALDAAALGAYLHGKAGDSAAASISGGRLKATDFIRSIRSILPEGAEG
jgi:NAD(P)H-hydrate epimerase